jgi:uncharacterized protein
MAVRREVTFDVIAEDEERARCEAANVKSVAPTELEVVGCEALSRMPWQPRRFRYSFVHRPPAVESRDGRWEITFDQGRVWVTVYPSEGAGRPVMPEQLLAARRSWPATTAFDRDRLYAVIEKAEGVPVAVADYETPRHEPFKGLISPNDMAGYLVFGVNWTGADPLKDALAALEASGVLFGVDVDEVRIAVSAGAPGQAFLVARGAEAEVGEDAKLLQTFSPASPKIRPDGGVDFTACQLDEPVPVGEALLMIQPAKIGKEGKTVRGASLPTTFGKEIDLASFLGDGVALSDDGMQVIATMSGTPKRVGDKISILPLLRIERSVDRTTGNIDFPGNVVIDGDVTDGFRVRANGDITVRGVVQGARLESDSAVILDNGMFGRGVGEIVAKGYVQAEFLQECTVSTETDVLISKEIVRSTINAGNSVLAGQGKIVGGVVTATREILAGIVGTVSGTPTRLTLVPPPEQPGPIGTETTEATRMPARPLVRIHNRAYAPTHITIGMGKLLVEHETPYCRYVENNGIVSMTSFA